MYIREKKMENQILNSLVCKPNTFHTKEAGRIIDSNANFKKLSVSESHELIIYDF